MKKTVTLSEDIQREDQLIRKLLADRRGMGAFPKVLEERFAQSLADRSLMMIRTIATLGILIYFVVGIVHFPTVYLLADDASRLHDLTIGLLIYVNGALCLASLPIMAVSLGLKAHFQRLIIIASFCGIFFTSLLTMQYQTFYLVQQGGYIIVFVYMLVYFLTGISPITLWITCLFAGLLPLPLLWFFNIRFDPVVYIYAVIFSNFVGFFVSYSATSKERVSFLQARLLELDKIQAKALTKELERLSNEDPLTGLYNRRYFNQAIHHEWERAKRSNEPLSLVFVDVDCFKGFNDTYGHLEGDNALIQVADVLQENIQRSSDIAARYGGEEFILLLPNTPSAGAQVVASKIMQGVDRLFIENQSSSVSDYLTLSIGVATWHNEPNLTETQLVARADLAVYQAKNDGRHLVRVYEPSDAEENE